MGDITKQNVKRFDARSNKTSRGKKQYNFSCYFCIWFQYTDFNKRSSLQYLKQLLFAGYIHFFIEAHDLYAESREKENWEQTKNCKIKHKEKL